MLGNESLRDVFAPGPNSVDVAREYLSWQRHTRRRTALTVYQYAGKLESFLGFVDHESLDAVSTEQIEQWLARPRRRGGKGQPAAAATIAKEVSLLRGLYRFAVARGWCQQNPTALLYVPTVRNENPRPVTDEAWQHLWQWPSLGDEARVVLGLGYFCGLRRAEIANLRVDQVDVRRQRLNGFTRKGGGDDVLDYGELVGVVCDALPHLVQGGPSTFLHPLERTVRGASSALVLAWTMTAPRTRAKYPRPETMNDPQLIYKRMARWQREAGLVQQFTPHQLRHSFVTNLLRAGMPIHLVSRLANHSSISVTMRYAKVGGQDIRAWRTQRANSVALASRIGRW